MISTMIKIRKDPPAPGLVNCLISTPEELTRAEVGNLCKLPLSEAIAFITNKGGMCTVETE